MSADVVELDRYRPHIVRQACCQVCGNNWVAVVLATYTGELECPKCKHDAEDEL